MLRRTGDVRTAPLRFEEIPTPSPRERELLVRVDWCGVCRTDLHVVEGDLPPRLRALVPGHEVVGQVVVRGPQASTVPAGATVGVPWLHATCGKCRFCLSERENLCEEKSFTGYTVPGGYSDYVLADERFVLGLPAGDPARLAPLLCAGIIGYRAFRLADPPPGGRVGFFGFGGSAHLTLALASRLGYETVAYSRSPAHLELARKLGASETVLSGPEGRARREPNLDAAVVFAPAGSVVLGALAEVRKGSTVAIASIHSTPIPELDYDRLLAGERRLVSVEANTRRDARDFLDLAGKYHLEATVERRPLGEANEALAALKAGEVVGAVVLDCREDRSGGGPEPSSREGPRPDRPPTDEGRSGRRRAVPKARPR